MSMPFNEIVWIVMTSIVKGPLQRKYGKEAAKQYINKAKPICKQMFLDVDDIGKDNPMKGNVYGAFPFMAIWKAADGAITPEDYKNVITEMMSKPFVKKHMGHGNMNIPEDRKKLRESFRRNQEWVEKHPEYADKTWDFHFDDTKPEEGVYYHFTYCPLNAFARKYGFLEILPVMCHIDYLTAEIMHSTLHREHTLATGGEICDYWFVGDQSNMTCNT